MMKYHTTHARLFISIILFSSLVFFHQGLSAEEKGTYTEEINELDKINEELHQQQGIIADCILENRKLKNYDDDIFFTNVLLYQYSQEIEFFRSRIEAVQSFLVGIDSASEYFTDFTDKSKATLSGLTGFKLYRKAYIFDSDNNPRDSFIVASDENQSVSTIKALSPRFRALYARFLLIVKEIK